MTDKMREFVAEVKQLCKDFSDQRDRPYMGDVHAALDGLYEQWQSAQSAAVPVVGEVVAWAWRYSGLQVSTDEKQAEKIRSLEATDAFRPHQVRVLELVEKPTTSITAAELSDLRENAARAEVEQEQKAKFAFKCAALTSELDALREDAESYRRLVAAAKAEGMQHCTYPDCICPDGVSSGSCNIDLPFFDVVPI